MGKHIKLWVRVIFLLIFLMAITGCNKSFSGTEEKDTSGESKEEWVTVIEFDGKFSGEENETFSDVFEVNGGKLRATYDFNVNSDDGNAMIYILPEGWTKTTDADGNDINFT